MRPGGGGGGNAPWTVAADGVIVAVRLTPRAGRNALDGVEILADDRAVLKVRVRAAPSDGEANAALVTLLAKTMRVAPGRIAIVAGQSARIKRVKINGPAVELARALAELEQDPEKLADFSDKIMRGNKEKESAIDSRRSNRAPAGGQTA